MSIDNPHARTDEVVGKGFLTIAEALEFLRVSKAFLYAAMDRNELPYTKFGRSRRIPLQALIHYAADRLVR